MRAATAGAAAVGCGGRRGGGHAAAGGLRRGQFGALPGRADLGLGGPGGSWEVGVWRASQDPHVTKTRRVSSSVEKDAPDDFSIFV